MDLKFYKKQVDILRKRIEEIHMEKAALAYPHINYGGDKNERDPYKTLFNSDKYNSLLEEEAELENKIQIYCAIIRNTENLLESIESPVKEILSDIYLLGLSAKKVASLHYYSDEKSMYRVVRKTLKKSIFQESCH